MEIAKRRNQEEQLQIIRECRTSGLTVAEWCRREGINPNTYYNWIERLHKRGVLEKGTVVPQAIIREAFNPDIVKVEVTSPIAPISIPPNSIQVPSSTEISKHEQFTQIGAPLETVMEISMGAFDIKVTNRADTRLLGEVIRMIGGGLSC